jgi:hypothetical protein
MEVAINHLTELLNNKFTESKLLKERKPLPIYAIRRVENSSKITRPRQERVKASELAIRFVEPED